MDSQGLPRRYLMEDQIFSISHWTNPNGPCWISGEIKYLEHLGHILWYEQFFLRKTAFSEKRELAGVGGILRGGEGFIFYPKNAARLPEEALKEVAASGLNRSTNSHILIYNRVSAQWIKDSILRNIQLRVYNMPPG